MLGLSNATIVADRLDADERAKFDLGRQGETNIVNEAGLYNVILRSDKPEAKAFKRWVTHDVLPSIRKHGLYAVDELLNDPDVMIKAMNALKEERAERKRLEVKNAEMLPKAEFYDAVTGANSRSTHEIGLVAKIINYDGVGRNRLFEILRDEEILRGDNTPYQRYIDAGWFRVIESRYTKPNGDVWVNTKTVAYQKGVAGIKRILDKRGFHARESKAQ